MLWQLLPIFSLIAMQANAVINIPCQNAYDQSVSYCKPQTISSPLFQKDPLAQQVSCSSVEKCIQECQKTPNDTLATQQLTFCRQLAADRIKIDQQVNIQEEINRKLKPDDTVKPPTSGPGVKLAPGDGKGIVLEWRFTTGTR